MPDHLTQAPVLLVGSGPMAQAYARVLQGMDRPFVVMGRGATSAAAFEAAIGVPVGTGDLCTQLAARPEGIANAIIAVSAANLAEASRQVAAAGVSRLLIEKPAALSPADVAALDADLGVMGTEAYVAYNRRYHAATLAARERIAEDGGVVSFKFDFTEASRRIEALDKDPRELDGWFYGNSTHVVDLAFFLGGLPTHLVAASRGAMPWHPAGAVFVGNGETDRGAAFSYHANWRAPGRWGVEVMTAKRRMVFQPLEELHEQTHDSFALNKVAIADELDKRYKPGVYKQVEAFLDGANAGALLPLADHAKGMDIFQIIRDGGVLTPAADRVPASQDN